MVSTSWTESHRVAHHWLQARKDLEFWSRQIIRVATTFAGIIGVLSIWFDDPGRLPKDASNFVVRLIPRCTHATRLRVDGSRLAKSTSKAPGRHNGRRQV